MNKRENNSQMVVDFVLATQSHNQSFMEKAMAYVLCNKFIHVVRISLTGGFSRGSEASIPFSLALSLGASKL